MNPEIKIGYQEHTLDDVLKYFAKGFEAAPGMTVVGYEAFVDLGRRMVIFKMSLRKDDPDRIIARQ